MVVATATSGSEFGSLDAGKAADPAGGVTAADGVEGAGGVETADRGAGGAAAVG
ncbi:MAG TPA: hypothetical protein VLJ88_13225 [Propionibacteriaceae bacterium]|nr:hypothetical protein [Propionibacteriaceae bacterium]